MRRRRIIALASIVALLSVVAMLALGAATAAAVQPNQDEEESQQCPEGQSWYPGEGCILPALCESECETTPPAPPPATTPPPSPAPAPEAGVLAETPADTGDFTAPSNALDGPIGGGLAPDAKAVHKESASLVADQVQAAASGGGSGARPAGSLPYTGSATLGMLAAIGAVLLALGIGLHRGGRRAPGQPDR